MSLMLNLPPELETELSAEASRMGLALPEYVERLLLAGRPLAPMPWNGTDELVSYWQSEGLVGSRNDIADSQDHGSVIASLMRSPEAWMSAKQAR